MTKNTKKIIIFTICLIFTFVILYIMNIPRPISLKTSKNAVKNLQKMDELLAEDQPDWGLIEDLFLDDVSKYVSDTEHLLDSVRLDLKIEDAITEAIKGGYSPLQAIIVRRSLLRACLYHMEAQLLAPTEIEKRIEFSERQVRAETAFEPVTRFAEQAAPEHVAGLKDSMGAWLSGGEEEQAQQVITNLRRMTVDVIAKRLSKWNGLDKNDRQERLQAIVAQAEMRQLFHYVYPYLSKQNKDLAWQVLTEFANKPEEIEVEKIERAIAEILIMIEKSE